MASPMELTRKMLKEDGIMNGIVERYHPKSKKHPFGCTQDFLNIIDLIALDGDIVGYQVCGTDWMPHIRKITEEEKASTIEWLKCGGRLILIGWRKVKKKRGGKAMVWRPRTAEFFFIQGEIKWDEVK